MDRTSTNVQMSVEITMNIMAKMLKEGFEGFSYKGNFKVSPSIVDEIAAMLEGVFEAVGIHAQTVVESETGIVEYVVTYQRETPGEGKVTIH